MSISAQINEELKQAMKDKNEAALRALRGIKSALIIARTEKGGSDEVSDEKAIKAIQKLAKQRRESIDIYKQQGRADLQKTEEEELAVIEKFLPSQMSEDDVRAVVKKLVEQSGAKSAAEIGKVMPLVMKELGGKADGKMISALVKEALGK
jgi:uncharacterized protein YqeY